jgi:hypothetical protein
MAIPNLSVCFSQDPAGVEARVLDVEHQLLAYRRSISLGVLRLRVRHAVFEQDPAMVGGGKTWRLWFDGERSRADWTLTHDDSRIDMSGKTVLTPETFIQVMPNTDYVQLYGPQTRPVQTTEIPNPRLLGLVPCSLDSISQFGMERHFLVPGRRNFTMEAREEAGLPILVVHYDLEGPAGLAHVEYHVCPSRGHQPILLRLTGGTGESLIETSVASVLQAYGREERWFPEQVTFRSRQASRVVIEELVTIDEADFEEQIPAETFTLAGLGLAAGRTVSADGQLMTWDGGELVPVYAETKYSEPTDIAKQTTTVSVWFMLGNGILLATIITLVVMRRRRRP